MDTLLQVPQELLIGSIALLDRLPDAIRAMLSGLLLVLFLKFFEARIKANEVQFGQSFRKTALIALLFIPLLVWLFPASRMVVFVEDLSPRASPDRWAWLLLISIWAIGWLFSLSALVRSHHRSNREAGEWPLLNDEKLDARLAHWQGRLGMQQLLQLVAYPGGNPRLFTDRDRIGIPAAAQHWPGSTRDILLINNLCHLKKHHSRWHLIAQFTASVYWPVTWLQTLHQRKASEWTAAAAAAADFAGA